MRLYKISFSLFFWLTVCMPFSIYAEQTCNPNMISSTPTDQFTDNGDGTVTDTATGLMWKRCLEGYTYSGGVCTLTTVTTVNWDGEEGALSLVNSPNFAGHTDWRLPNIKELQSIVEEQCYSPAVNLEIFPDTPAAEVWSNSPMATSPSTLVWIIDFSQGDMIYKDKTSNYNVRLVRDDVTN
jgi:hypothetical protein